MTGTQATVDQEIKARLKFSASDHFLKELRQRVDAYFKETGKTPRDCPRMYLKTATIAAWFLATYLSLLFVATSWWAVGLLAISMGLAVAAVGFNIQHDGGHKAYSNHKWVNKIMAMSLDLMGGSSYLWNWKHNSIHHTYPNITGEDDDIDVGILARLSPHQKRYAFHRAQGYYLWILYGFLAVKWHFIDDFYNIAIGEIGGHKIPRPKGWDLVGFIGGKLAFLSWAFIIPLLLGHPFWAVLSVYLFSAFLMGVVLATVFQLAHCVEQAEFPMPNPETGKMDTDWAVHQVQTTVDFSRTNPFLCWFLGGLNFQIEHHLLHGVCHVHYPAISNIVESVCKDFGIRYQENKTLVLALASHFRWLQRMAQPVG